MKLQVAKEQSGLSYKDMAEKLGIHYQSLLKWKRNKRRLTHADQMVLGLVAPTPDVKQPDPIKRPIEGNIVFLDKFKDVMYVARCEAYNLGLKTLVADIDNFIKVL